MNIIENQENFIILEEKALQMYPEVTKLTITNTGLKHIDENAFRNTKLKEIDLKNNRIKILPWKVFHGNKIVEINIEGNPLTCDCNSKWIQHKMKNFEAFLGPFGDEITCFDYKNNRTERLYNVTIDGCGRENNA
ncbi:NT-3 growth factor receptor-like protein [Dinothrombium tinctorium]|uniref:NT-3 growth factor receptor-like protein n=1 Tax=Dinothrombium tinctorium TaxID=1965070 RepID=A0A443QG20_9ACAR|nr:NT-3 growth factor receptor-like protein [Dinothrombium tinctorium]